VIGRLWRTELKAGRGDAYDNFAREISLPMFRQQEGFLGCVMTRSDEEGLVLTFWRDQDAVRALDRSPSYQTTVARIVQAEVLAGTQTTEVMDVHLLDLHGVRSE
jgi:heme-degrading monooxygenase HmoA